MRLDAWLADAEARLAGAGIDSPRLEAQVLAGHILGQNRSWVLAHPDAEIDGGEALVRRAQGEPLAYILGWREFYGRRFSVAPGVLIPRHETEILIDAALEIISEHEITTAIDIGTGSGCLTITLKLERPELEVSAVDISEEALEIAKANARDLGADISFKRGDLLRGFTAKYGLIISNPPYIALGDPLPKDVADWEPPSALYAGEDGLAIYKRLAWEAPASIEPGGWMIVEMGDGMADAAVPHFDHAGWIVHRVEPDLDGMPRAAILQWPSA